MSHVPVTLSLQPPRSRAGAAAREVPVGVTAVDLDADQRAAVDDDAPALLVRGAAGSGKTTTALALVERAITSGLDPARVLLLAPTRRGAGALRDELSARLARTIGSPVVRTPASAAFSVLRARAAMLGEPAPALITGPEQDQVLAEILAGHAVGEGSAPEWPTTVPPAARGTRAFRDELRDLLMRAAERGLRPEDLARLGERRGRPEWVAAAAVYEEYLAVTRLRAGTPDVGERYDAAVVVDEAAEALLAWDQEVPGAGRPTWDLVVVDDYQEVTAATARLLHVLQDDGARLVLMADPDAAVQTFRGASPDLVGRASVGPPGSELGAFGARERLLGRVWRHGEGLRRVAQEVTAEVRGTSRDHREAVAREGAEGTAEVAFLRTPAQEAAFVAWVLRSARLHDGLPWSSMAVVVRSGAQVRDLRRALVGAQVPCAGVGSDVPLRSEPAVRPLLEAAAAVLDPENLDGGVAAGLLTSPLGGMDAVELRRLRRALRAEEIAGGGSRTSDPLLAEVVADPGRAALLPSAVRSRVLRLARVLEAGRGAAAQEGTSVLDVLWALWSTAGLADPWRRVALRGGVAGARADRDLDAVLSLFSAAERFVERMPQAPPAAFLEHLRGLDLPADSLAAQADAGESVSVVTAAAAAGQEWDLVVVAGVQEGVWPDLRLRDSILGAGEMVDLLAGRGVVQEDRLVDARAAVLDDELRAFAVAVTRARERLVVTAVADSETRPSPLVDLVQPGPADDGPDPRARQVPVALDLRAVVADARQDLESAAGAPEAADLAAHPAAALLARLAAEGVPGADPDQWAGLRELTTDAPLWDADADLRLSPSKLESVTTCSLRWALEAAGGTGADTGAQSLGTLVHAVAAAHPDGTLAELTAELDARWGELGLPEGWMGAAQRRRADRMLERLAGYCSASGEVVGVEVPFTAAVGRVVLAGVVDRLERVVGDDGVTRLRVVDLKTGRNAVSNADVGRHPQLGAYQLAVEAGAFVEVAGEATPAGASLVYVGTDAKKASVRDQPPLQDDEDPAWASELVAEVADTVSRSAVHATANGLCRVCPVTRSCPLQSEGRVVGS